MSQEDNKYTKPELRERIKAKRAGRAARRYKDNK